MSPPPSDRALVLAKSIFTLALAGAELFDGDASTTIMAIAAVLDAELHNAEHDGFASAIDMLKIRERALWSI
jgi:hypothetical protein